MLLELTPKKSALNNNDSVTQGWNNCGDNGNMTDVGNSLAGGGGSGGVGEANERIVKKGLMWVQQDKLFSRWKEVMILVKTNT